MDEFVQPITSLNWSRNIALSILFPIKKGLIYLLQNLAQNGFRHLGREQSKNIPTAGKHSLTNFALQYVQKIQDIFVLFPVRIFEQFFFWKVTKRN